MKSPLTMDRQATSLLDRVREDVSHLRNDIGKLLTHTTRETLPNNARELADQAKQQFAAGSAYAASRLRGFRAPAQQHHTGGWMGGAVLAGLIGYGVYMLCRDSCTTRAAANEEIDPEDELSG